MHSNIVIGKIIGEHGINGELKVLPITDDINRFFDLSYFLIGDKRYNVKSVRIHKNAALILTEELADRTQAEKLRGSFISVDRKDALELSEGEYYIEDLKGMSIRDTKSDNIGVLTDILQNGAVDLIEYTLSGETYLMPYLNEYVKQVDIENNFMVADLSKGVKS